MNHNDNDGEKGGGGVLDRLSQMPCEDAFLRDSEWTLLWEFTEMKNQSKFYDMVYDMMNGTDEVMKTRFRTMIATRQMLYDNIKSLIQFTQEVFTTKTQHEVIHFAKTCIRFQPKQAHRKDVCVFTGQSQNHNNNNNEDDDDGGGGKLIRMSFETLDVQTGQLHESAEFAMQVFYGTILRAINLVHQSPHFMTRVSHMQLEAVTPEAKREADRCMRQLPEALNYASYCLYSFLLEKKIKKKKGKNTHTQKLNELN